MRSQIAAAALLGAALSGSSGCQPTPRPDVENQATLVAEAGEPIVFRSDVDALSESTADPKGTLTLPEAIRLSAKHDPRIQAAISRVRMAEAESDQARLLPNPVVDIAIRFPTSGGKSIIDAGLNAELVSLLQRPGRVSAADNRLRSEAAEAVGIVLDVLSEIRESYTAVQALDALVVVQQDRRQILDRLLETARARLNLGEATQLDVTTLETQRVELETEIADKELERREARLTLARLVGDPSGAASWKVTPWEAPAAHTASESQWVELALKRRPQVTSLEYQLKALGAERSLTRFAPFDKGEAGVASERDPDWSVGPSFSLPLPLFDTGSAARAKATAAVIEARHKLQESRREAVEETRRAYATYLSTKENLARVQGELLPLQERRLAQAEAQYKAGQTEITSLFLAEQDLRAARARLIELQRRVTESQIRLEKTAGGPGVANDAFGAMSGASTAPTTKGSGL